MVFGKHGLTDSILAAPTARVVARDRDHPRPRAVARSVALPATRAEALELRDLLEANLAALQALHDEHRRMLELNLWSIDGVSELRRELRAIGSPRAPWVRALSETRVLLFVALRELIVGVNQADLSRETTDESSR